MASPVAGTQGRRVVAVLGSLAVVEVASIVAGLAAAYLSLVFVGRLGFKSSPADTRDLYIGAASASAAVGLLFWRVLTSREHILTLGQGILLGIGLSVLAHPIMWFVAWLVNDLTADPSVFIGFRSQMQLPIPLEVLLGTTFAVYSLIYVGWITSLVWGITGVALAWLGRHFRAA